MYELHDALRDISKIFSLFDELDFDSVWARFWTTYEKYFLYIWNFFSDYIKAVRFQSDSNLDLAKFCFGMGARAEPTHIQRKSDWDGRVLVSFLFILH